MSMEKKWKVEHTKLSEAGDVLEISFTANDGSRQTRQAPAEVWMNDMLASYDLKKAKREIEGLHRVIESRECEIGMIKESNISMKTLLDKNFTNDEGHQRELDRKTEVKP